MGFNTSPVGTGDEGGSINVMSILDNEDGTLSVIINNPYGHDCFTENGHEYWRGIGQGVILDGDLVVDELSYVCGNEVPFTLLNRFVADRQNGVIKELRETNPTGQPSLIFHRVGGK